MKIFKIVTLTLILFAIIPTTAQHPEFKVKVVGSGVPVLLFPGFTCTDAVWDDTVAELSKNNQCHVFTFAGFGDVPPIAFPWLPKIEEAVLEYVKTNALERPALIGHSLGGTLALSLAAKEDIFGQLIIVDALTATGALFFPDYESGNMVYDSPYNTNILAMGADDFKGMAAQMATSMSVNQEKRQQLIYWMLQADRETYVFGYTDYLKLDLREAVAQIKSPVTILAATLPFGKEAAQKTYEGQYKNLTGYDLKFAEGSAHFIMYDQPEWFLEQVKNVFAINE